MKENHITSFKIENFKRFKSFEIKNIGQYNLIVGDNNVGKTTLLESLLLTDNISETIGNLSISLSFRNYKFLDTNTNIFESFFNESTQPISYSNAIKDKTSHNEFSVVRTRTLSKEQQNELALKNIGNQPSQYSIVLKNFQSNQTAVDFIKVLRLENYYAPFIKYNTAYGEDLFKFFSERIQTSKSLKVELIKNLELLIPDIEDIEITGGSPTTLQTFLVTLKTSDKPRLVNEFGDGSIKFLRYLLEIIECKGKRLMIDEIDTGIHYSRMKKLWKVLLTVAKENDVQIFATTHSKECMEYFKLALKEINLENDSRIISLEETSEKSVKAYSYFYNDFVNALDSDLEIRGNN